MPRYTSEFHAPHHEEKLSMIDNSCETTMWVQKLKRVLHIYDEPYSSNRESHKMNGHAGNEKWGGTMSTTGGLEGKKHPWKKTNLRNMKPFHV